ncbi:hypothetical protein BU16DRAFT_622269 [Lophium mytilinum]|uniref:Uncharacterized protein n=1 Tax=Lophium mytilinum TaxID=390894 RepID=A0A6A6QD81_9PEZI|nr:hypothetical protein BU16DRAFT_622269 [Lophium mytilinum]
MASTANENSDDMNLQQQTEPPGLLHWGEVAFCYLETTVIIGLFASVERPTPTYFAKLIALVVEAAVLLLVLQICRWRGRPAKHYFLLRAVWYTGRLLCVGGTLPESRKDTLVRFFGAQKLESSTGLWAFYIGTAEGNTRTFMFFAGSVLSILCMMWEKDQSPGKRRFWGTCGPYFLMLKTFTPLIAMFITMAVVFEIFGIELSSRQGQRSEDDVEPSMALFVCILAWFFPHLVIVEIKALCWVGCRRKDCKCAYEWTAAARESEYRA